MKKLLLSTIAATAMLGLAAQAQAEIRIGVAGPITGQYATFGAQMRGGAEQAVADINAAGGLLGQQLVLEVGDDACDPRQAVSVAGNFAGSGVVFVAGHFCSGSSIPASEVYAEEGILMISPASTNPAFTDERPADTIYRVCGRDDQQGEVAGNFIAEKFADARVAIIHDRTAYGKGLADLTMENMRDAGKQETLYEAISAGEQDYRALITRLQQENIDIVYLGGYHTEGGLIVRQMRDQGMDALLIGGDALVTDEFWSITGEAGAGTLMTFSPDPRKNPGAASVVAALEAAGQSTEGYALYTYAAVQIFAQAAEAAGSVDIEAVNEMMKGMTFDTVLGELSFDENGDVTLPGYVFYEWADGTYEQIN